MKELTEPLLQQADGVFNKGSSAVECVVKSSLFATEVAVLAVCSEKVGRDRIRCISKDMVAAVLTIVIQLLGNERFSEHSCVVHAT